jgi:site-specific recombinase XerD
MFTTFEDYLETQDRSPVTIRNYLSDLRQFANWFEQINRMPPTPQAVTTLDVRDYRQYLLTVKHNKANTINRHLASISRWLAWAVSTDQIDHNPSQQINGIREVNLSPKWLTRPDEGALLRQVERGSQVVNTISAKRQALRNRVLVLLMLNTGLRAGEVCNLEIGDLEISDRKGDLFVRKGKGRKQRHIPLNKQARKGLVDWLAIRPETEHTWVFLGQRGDQLSTSALRRIVSELAYAAKLDPQEVSPHVLRHTFGKRLIDQGVSLEKVAALMGHSNLNTTRIYLTPGQIDLEQAVRVLEY